MRLIQNLMNAARRFTATDFAVFKICLVAIGVLLGASFSDFFLQWITIVWIVAVASWLVLMVQVVRYYGRK